MLAGGSRCKGGPHRRRAGLLAPAFDTAPAPKTQALRRLEAENSKLRKHLAAEKALREKYAEKLEEQALDWVDQVRGVAVVVVCWWWWWWCWGVLGAWGMCWENGWGWRAG